MYGGMSGSSSMLALKRREGSFHGGSSRAPQGQAGATTTSSTPHGKRAPSFHEAPHRTPRTSGGPLAAMSSTVGVMAGLAAPPSPESSGSNSSITSGIHVFTAPSRSGVSSARQLPQYNMQPTPRSHGGLAPSAPSSSSRTGAVPTKLTAQPQLHQQRVPASKRPKKILSSVMSATNFYSNTSAAATSGTVDTLAQQARHATFTYGAPNGVVPRVMAPPSPGGSPDPIDAFSSPIPLRSIHLQAHGVFDDEEDEDDFLNIVADMKKIATEAAGTKKSSTSNARQGREKTIGHKRTLSQLISSDDSDNEAGIKAGTSARREQKSRPKDPQPSSSSPLDVHKLQKLAKSKPLPTPSASIKRQPSRSQIRNGKDNQASAIAASTAKTPVSAALDIDESSSSPSEIKKKAKKVAKKPRSVRPEPTEKLSDEAKPATTTRSDAKARRRVTEPLKVKPTDQTSASSSKPTRARKSAPAEQQAASTDSVPVDLSTSSRPQRKAKRKSIIESSDEDQDDDDDEQEGEDTYDVSSDAPKPKQARKTIGPVAKRPRKLDTKAEDQQRPSRPSKANVDSDKESEDEDDWSANLLNPVLQLLEDDADHDTILDLKLQPRLSAGKAKGIDNRTPMRRLLDLVQEIIEGDDILPVDATSTESMCAEAALVFAVNQRHVLLRTDVLHSLLRLIKTCKSTSLLNAAATQPSAASPQRRQQQQETEARSIADMDVGQLGRLLHVLERTMRTAGDARPFDDSQHSSSTSDEIGQPSNTKGADTPGVEKSSRTKKVAQTSKTTKGEESQDRTGHYLELAQHLERIASGVLAAECCLELLSTDGLPSTLSSEDILRACLNALKVAVNETILPFVEGCADPKSASTRPLLRHFIQNLVPAPLKKKQRGRTASKNKVAVDVKAVTAITTCGDRITSVFVRTYAALGASHELVSSKDVRLSEGVLVDIVMLALRPFFTLEPEATVTKGKSAAAGSTEKRTAIDAVGGTSAMRSLRSPAMRLLRSVFARNPEHRSWIIEEVLSSLSKVAGSRRASRQIVLRSGKSVDYLTTLLLHLVQASAHGFRDHIHSKSAPDSVSQSPTSSRSAYKRRGSQSPAKSDSTEASSRAALWMTSMEGPQRTASSISNYIMQRVSASKTTKSTNDAMFIPLIEGLMGDLLEMVFLPEWPGAAILLTPFCIAFCSALNEPQSGPETRGIAIDMLGAAAARLRAVQCQFHVGTGATEPARGGGAVRLVRDIINERDEVNTDALEALQQSYVTLRKALGRISDEDRSTESARELLEALWIAEMAAAMTRLAEGTIGGDAVSVDESRALEALAEELKQAPKEVGKDLPRSDEITPAQYQQLTATSYKVLSSTAFMVQYEMLQQYLLDATERQAVTNRAKAVRALSCVASVDPDLLADEEVRLTVEARLEDSSIGVREAAISLLIRYVLHRPKEIHVHFEQVVHHLTDTGVSVRKRVVRFLADTYNLVTDKRLQAECCARLIGRVTDEDTAIQDLAVATIAKLWFDVSMQVTDSKRGKLVAVDEAEDVNPKPTSSGESECLRHAEVITMVTAMICEKPSPLNEVFSRLLQQCQDQDADKLRTALRALSDALIDAIVNGATTDASQGEQTEASKELLAAHSTSVFDKVKTVHLLVSTLPSVLTITRGKALLPFLKGAQSDAELQVVQALLRVFSAALPAMPKTAIAFAAELERALLPLINRPRLSALQDLTECFVKVIKLHTHNYSILLKMFAQCYGRLQFAADHVSVAPSLKIDPATSILIALTTRLCECADFDELRREHDTLAPQINNMTSGSVVESVYSLLVTIYQSEDTNYKASALQSLGWLFRSFPALLGRDDATRTMDEVLAQGDAQQRELLLSSLLEFLNGQQQNLDSTATKKDKTKNTDSAPVNMTELIGDTDAFAESSVSSVVVQRYLDRILEAALCVRVPSLQRTALAIVKVTVLQGLSHPLQCVPTLIALETSAVERIRQTAIQMHSHLSVKHASILAVRYLDHARAAFNFQLSIKDIDQLRGLRMDERPAAMLSDWYSLVAEKRQTKLDMLKALVKAFDTGRFEAPCSREDVAFARFLADNLALFDYSTNEEVLLIVAELRTILSVAGMQTHAAIDDELEERAAELKELAQSSQKKTSTVWIEIPTVSRRPQRGQNGDKAGADANADQVEATTLQASQSQTASSEQILDKARETELARTSTILSFALALRNQLKWLYSLSEARCAKYVPGRKASAGADKPAIRRALSNPNAAVLELSSFPGAFVSCESSRDALLQMQAFHNAIAEEGTILEADEDDYD